MKNLHVLKLSRTCIGSTTLICTYTTYCTLKIKEPYGSGKKLAKIHRGQIVRSNQVEINKKGQITKFITNDGEPDINNISSDFGEATSVSYTLVLKPYHKGIGNQGEVSYNDDVAHELHPTENEMESSLEKMALELDKNNEYVILLRKYAKKKRRSSVRQQHNRLKSYILRKRKRLTVRENKSPNWFGVLSFVFGLFSTMLTALIGQFWEEDKRPFVSRRGRNQGTKRPNNYPSRSSTSGTRTSVAYGESSSRGVHTVVNRRK